MPRPSLKPLALFLLLAAAPAGAETETAAAPANLPAITVTAIAQRPLVERVRASGLIEPAETVYVQPLIEGQAIDEVLVEVGDHVEAGDVLARLSDSALALQRSQLDATHASAEAAIAQAEAQLVEAEAVRDKAFRDRDRAQRLAAQGATSATAADAAISDAATAVARVSVALQGLNAAKAQLRVVEAQVADIELQLRRTSVVAPVAGEISAREARIGAIASMSGAPLFSIIRDGLLELRADVAEQDIADLRPGMEARMTVVGLATPLVGAIRLVEPTVDPVTRQGRIRIAVDDPARVRAGMFADAEIVVVAKEALAAPVSAVRRENGGGAALVVRDGVVTQAPIVTGIRDNGFVEIVDGLAAGDTIVLKAGAFVRDGDHVNPVAAEPAVPASN